VHRLLHDFPHQVRLVVLQLPSGRKNAKLTAEAALAAWGQGKYWQMDDKLAENFPRFDRKELLQYAGEIGLDMELFKRDLDTKKYEKIIERDQKLGAKLGVFATPTFFINGRMQVGAPPYPEFKAMIEEELAKEQ
jgi:protein-disulfide isomerase